MYTRLIKRTVFNWIQSFGNSICVFVIQRRNLKAFLKFTDYTMPVRYKHLLFWMDKTKKIKRVKIAKWDAYWVVEEWVILLLYCVVVSKYIIKYRIFTPLWSMIKSIICNFILTNAPVYHSCSFLRANMQSNINDAVRDIEFEKLIRSNFIKKNTFQENIKISHRKNVAYNNLMTPSKCFSYL